MKEGTLVAVWLDSGEVLITTTSSEVYELPRDAHKKGNKGIPVVHLNGVRGYYAVFHVRPITGNNIHHSAFEPLRMAVVGED